MIKRMILTLVSMILLSTPAFAERGKTKISVFPLPPKLSATIQFHEPSGNNILDACFSGNSEKGMLFKNISPAMVKVKKEYASPGNALLLTSGAVDQVSTWFPEKRHSLFTYFFLNGLQGEADTNRDKKITVGEMKEYLKEHVPYMAQRLSGVVQTPVVTGNDQEVIVQLKK